MTTIIAPILRLLGRDGHANLRVPPGGGMPVDVPPGMRIQDAFMPLPYKETGASFAFSLSERFGGWASC
jgi:hypothetical protein